MYSHAGISCEGLSAVKPEGGGRPRRTQVKRPSQRLFRWDVHNSGVLRRGEGLPDEGVGVGLIPRIDLPQAIPRTGLVES